jgi:Tol biopolymer transport system component
MLNHKGSTMLRIARVVGLACAGCLMPAVPPALAAFPGDNGRILFDSARGGDADIWTIGPHGGNPVNLTAGSDAEEALANWRPDGRRIVFMSDRETPRNPDPRGSRGPDFELFVMRDDGSDPTQLTFNTFDDEDPAWSPDGKRIVFARDFNPVRGKVRYDVLTMNADGTGERNITDRPGDDFQPNWSSKNRIAFTSDRDGDPEIYTMSPNGAKVRRLTRNSLNDEFANWSPDGKTIAFHRARGDNFDLYTVRARGGGLRRLTRDPDGEGLPTWSPDGREIAFLGVSDSGPGIYTMRADGRNRVKRTGNAFEPFAPDWQPIRHR